MFRNTSFALAMAITIVVAHSSADASCFTMIDPRAFAAGSPLIVKGEIVRIDEGIEARRTWDVAHIKVESVHKCVLSDVRPRPGEQLAVRMHGRKSAEHRSTDLRYPAGTHALWLIYVDTDGELSICHHPQQREKIEKLEEYYLKQFFRDGLFEIPNRLYSRRDWFAALQAARDETHSVQKKFSPEWQQIHEQVEKVLPLLLDSSKSITERFAYLGRQPDRVRQTLCVQYDALRRLPGLQRALYLHFMANDPSAGVRASAANALGSITPADSEVIAALSRAVRKEDAQVRVSACHALARCKPAEGVDLAEMHETMMAAMDSPNATDQGSVAQAAAQALGQRLHAPARDRIVKLFRDHANDEQIAQICTEALSRIGGANDEVLQSAHMALRSDNWNARYSTVAALAEIPSEKLVPFLVHHLPTEMAHVVNNIREHSVDDRPLAEMVRLLEKHTKQKFGTDINGWIDWLNANESKYVRWSNVPPQSVEPLLIDEYQWLMKHRAWYRCLNRLQSPQLPSPKVNVPRWVDALTYLDKIVAEAPRRRRQQLADCLPSLRKLLEQRERWILNDESEGSLFGPAEVELVAFWLNRAIMHWSEDAVSTEKK